MSLFYVLDQINGMWLSPQWIQKVMTGVGNSTRSDLSSELVKIRLASWAYLSTRTVESLSPQGKSTAKIDCPAFMRKAFKEALDQRSDSSLKELLLICQRYNIEFPGEWVPESFRQFHPGSSMSDRYLSGLETHLTYLSNYFDEYRHFRDPEDNEWEEWAPLQRYAYLKSRLIWKKGFDHFRKIDQLPSSERSDLLSAFVYEEWDQRKTLAEELGDSRSQKTNAWVHAYQLNYTDHHRSRDGLEFISKMLTYSQGAFHLKTDKELPFTVAAPRLLESYDIPIFHLISWMDPEMIFTQWDVPPDQFTKAMTKFPQQKEMIAALIHAAVYHKRYDWLQYGLDMIRHCQLQELTQSEAWASLARRIPPGLILNTFHKALEESETDMDRIDAIEYWLYPADLFLSREITEELWPAIATGVELLDNGGLSSLRYKMLFQWIQNRIYPGFPIHWTVQKRNAGLVAEFQEAVNRRYHFYKSLNEWLRKNPHS